MAKETFKDNGLLFTIVFLSIFLISLALGSLLLIAREQSEQINELVDMNNDLYYELIITRDTLNQIEMRDEAIKYIDEASE